MQDMREFEESRIQDWMPEHRYGTHANLGSLQK